MLPTKFGNNTSHVLTKGKQIYVNELLLNYVGNEIILLIIKKYQKQ